MLNSIIKDLKVNIFDGKQMITIIAMPLVLTVILSFALGGTFSSSGLSEPINVAVVKLYDSNQNFADIFSGVFNIEDMPEGATDEIQSQMGDFNPESMFFDNFLDSEDMAGIISYEIMDDETAQKALDEQSVSAIIYIPENYIRATYANMFGIKETVEFEVAADASSTYSAGIAEQVVRGFTDTFSVYFANGEVFSEVAGQYLTEQELYRNIQTFYQNLASAGSQTVSDIKTESVEQYEVIDSFTYYTAAMLCMFMLFSAGIGGRSMLEEKENVTYYRMKVLGVTYFQMMVSKMVVVLVICLLQSVVMIGMSAVFFKVNWGNYLMVAVIALLGSFAIGGLGSFIGAISLRSGNFKLANAFEGAIVQLLALFGGSYIPLSVLPKFFAKLSKATVNGQALSAYIKTAQGMGISSIWTELISVLLFGIAFFIAAWALISAEGRKENA